MKRIEDFLFTLVWMPKIRGVKRANMEGGGVLFRKIKPHYRSEGPRQGSCGVFGGVLILSGVLYIIYILLWSIQLRNLL